MNKTKLQTTIDMLNSPDYYNNIVIYSTERCHHGGHGNFFDNELTYMIAKHLQDKNKLKRVYAEHDIDSYLNVGVDKDKIVHLPPNSECEDKDEKIVFPKEVNDVLHKDFGNKCNVDLMLVLGSDLSTIPYCAIVNAVGKNIKRIMVSFYASEPRPNSHSGKTVKVGKRNTVLEYTWDVYSKWNTSYDYGRHDTKSDIFNIPCSIFYKYLAGLPGYDVKKCLEYNVYTYETNL